MAVNANANASHNAPGASAVRIGYTSMITPDSVYDVDLVTRAMTLRKQKPVLGGYDAADYEQFREWAQTRPGVPLRLRRTRSATGAKDPPRSEAT